MNQGSFPMPYPLPALLPAMQPGAAVLTAINELAAQVRALGLHRADELLAELLVELHAGPSDTPLPAGQDGWGD